MLCKNARGWWSALVVAALPLVALAASPSKRAAEPLDNSVELFAGMESGDIDVKVIPKDSTGGLVLLTNKTDKPLSIKIPAAFAGVPVAAQFDAGMGDTGYGDGGGGGGMNQGFGGGMMGGMGGMGGMMGGMGGMGGGFFNVAPDKVIKVRMAAVCLDHGKKDPNPRVEYKLIPIEKYAKSDAVAELVAMLTLGQIDQHSAQAAAWHLQNGMSWEELANKIGAKHLNGTVEPYFTPAQLHRAMAAAHVAESRAERNSREPSQERSIGDELARN